LNSLGFVAFYFTSVYVNEIDAVETSIRRADFVIALMDRSWCQSPKCQFEFYCTLKGQGNFAPFLIPLVLERLEFYDDFPFVSHLIKEAGGFLCKLCHMETQILPFLSTILSPRLYKAKMEELEKQNEKENELMLPSKELFWLKSAGSYSQNEPRAISILRDKETLKMPLSVSVWSKDLLLLEFNETFKREFEISDVSREINLLELLKKENADFFYGQLEQLHNSPVIAPHQEIFFRTLQDKTFLASVSFRAIYEAGHLTSFIFLVSKSTSLPTRNFARCRASSKGRKSLPLASSYLSQITNENDDQVLQTFHFENSSISQKFSRKKAKFLHSESFP